MPAPTLTREDIVKGLRKLGIDGAVEVHSSLSAFGWVEGGAEAVADALLEAFALVMVPAFSSGSSVTMPPGVRIERNGWRRHWWHGRHRYTPRPFHKDMPTSGGMGVITEAVRQRPGTVRGIHPSHSFAANGEGAEEIVAAQTYDDPMAPVVELCNRGGWILMLGTELNSCTALHACEVLAGRPYFARYALVEEGRVVRIGVPGCSHAFYRFAPVLEEIKREVRIGNARVHAYPGKEFLELSVAAIKRDPEMTVCRPECPACADMLAGGPIIFE